METTLQGTREGCRRKPSAPRASHAQCLTVSNVPLDVTVRPDGQKVGPKQPAQIRLNLGGPAANGAAVPKVNGISAAVVGVQAGGFAADACRRLAADAGLQPLIIERPNQPPALTVGTPNGSPGAFDLSIQRIPPLKAAELTGPFNATIASADAVIVGPMPWNRETRRLLLHIATIARYRALVPHPSMLRDPAALIEVGSQFHFFQVNLEEAQLLDPHVKEVELLALRGRHLLGEGVEFAVTNGGGRGLLWAAPNWFSIAPPRMQVISDVGAGHIFCTAYVLARRLFRARPKPALDYAVRVAAAKVSGTSIPPWGA